MQARSCWSYLDHQRTPLQYPCSAHRGRIPSWAAHRRYASAAAEPDRRRPRRARDRQSQGADPRRSKRCSRRPARPPITTPRVHGRRSARSWRPCDHSHDPIGNAGSGGTRASATECSVLSVPPRHPPLPRCAPCHQALRVGIGSSRQRPRPLDYPFVHSPLRPRTDCCQPTCASSSGNEGGNALEAAGSAVVPHHRPREVPSQTHAGSAVSGMDLMAETSCLFQRS